MTLFDDQVELYVTNQKPGLIVVWNRNPNEVALKGYYVTYDAMTPAVKQAAQSWLGTPPAPAPASYGDQITQMDVRVTNTRSGDTKLATVWGPVSNITQTLTGTNSFTNYWTVNFDAAAGYNSASRVTLSYSGIEIPLPAGTQPNIRIVFAGTATPTPLVPGSGGYPALSPADVALVDAFFAGLRSIGNPFQPASSPVLAQLVGQVEDVRQRTIELQPKVEETRTGVGNLGPPLAEVQLGNAAILLKLEDILNCTCRLVVEDCAGDDRVGLAEALKVIIGVVCEIQKKLGYSPGKITVPGAPARDLLTVREALSDLMRRTGFNNPVNTFQCDEPVVLNNLEDAVALVQGTLGYGVGVDSGRTNNDGEPIIICNVSATFDEVLKRPSDVHYIDGYERFDSPYPLLKIVFSAEDTYRHDHQITLAGVTLPPDKAAILAVVDPYRIGDWLCRVYLATNRKLEGWYEDKETGWAHLKKLAILSALPLRVGEDTAIFQPANAPTKWRGSDLYPRVAYWSDSAPNGLGSVTIGLR